MGGFGIWRGMLTNWLEDRSDTTMAQSQLPFFHLFLFAQGGGGRTGGNATLICFWAYVEHRYNVYFDICYI